MPPKDFFLIDYAHFRGGVLYHGTLSDTDGVVQSTWTYEQGGQKVTKPGQITSESFQQLWDGVSGSPVFERATVRDAATKIDPEHFHVVGIAFNTGGQQGMRTFLVPDGESDPEFMRWLSALAVPP